MSDFSKLLQVLILSVLAYFAMLYHEPWIVMFPFALMLIIVFKSQKTIHYKKTIEYALNRFGCYNVSCGACGRVICYTTVEQMLARGFDNVHRMELEIYKQIGIVVVIKIEESQSGVDKNKKRKVDNDEACNKESVSGLQSGKSSSK